MTKISKILPIQVESVPENKSKPFYPEPFASVVKDRVKRKLGDYFELENFGVNLTTMAPNSTSALKHHHSKQDEFIYIISGPPTLVYGDEKFQMVAGDCMGFKAGSGIGHQLLNNTSNEVVYIEVGDRTANDIVKYPDDDLVLSQNPEGSWSFAHKDGSTY
ncbi:TPA: cupin domain-containing protein [Vibrio parahaemolyticus]